MEPFDELDIRQFLYAHRHYHGLVKPENLVFNANLQEFAQRISYICNLQTRGKLSPQEAHSQINELWKHLESSYRSLGIEPDED